MDPLQRLARSDKDTLIGNLIRSIGDQPGLGTVLWGEEVIAREGLGIYLLHDGRTLLFQPRSFTWRPDRIVATHSAAGLELAECRFVHDDALVDELTLRNAGPEPLRACLLLLSELEGRKAAARCAAVPGAADALACLVDLTLSRRAWVALGTSRPPDALRWAPFRRPLLRYLAGRQGPPLQDGYKQDLVHCGLAFDLDLAPGETVSWTVALAAGTTPGEALRALQEPLSASASCHEASTAAWQRFMTQEVPHFDCSRPELVDLYYYVWQVQRANRLLVGNRRLPWPFGAPAKFKYPHLWLWDACLQSIVLRWLRDPAYAQGNLRSVANQQYPNGMLPHETFLWPGTARGNWPDGDGQSSSVTQPPVFGLALWEYYLATGDRTLLADLWPALERYDRWFADCRDQDGDGLYAFVHRWETGWDNSPRWDAGFDVEPVEVNAFIAIQRQVLACCAEMFGLRKRARAHQAQAEALASAVRRLMWDGSAAIFCDLDAANVPSPVRTPAAFIPLLAGLASQEQAAALLGHLLDPAEFWTEYPLPCLARNHPEFDPNDYWRGPTWIHLDWMVVRGLLRYGYRSEAAELVRRILCLMLRPNGPTCNECYNPLTGAEARTPDLSWSGLVNDLLITALGGLVPRADGQLECHPLDLGLDSFLFADLPYRGHRVGLAFDRKDGYRVALDGRTVARRPDLGPLGPLPLAANGGQSV